MARFLVAAVAAAVAAAHMCALSPLQRGGAAGAAKAGAAACLQPAGPCPITVAGPPTASYLAGSVAYLSLQKNMDHWVAGVQGFNFSASLLSSDYKTSTFLGFYPDGPAPALTVYQLPVTIPNVTAGAYVIQSIYYAPGVANFYQARGGQLVPL